jgi:hypothetical protein
VAVLFDGQEAKENGGYGGKENNCHTHVKLVNFGPVNFILSYNNPFKINRLVIIYILAQIMPYL